MAENEFTIGGGALEDIQIGASGIYEVVQNVRVILATVEGTLILDRGFGVAADIVDLPLLAARQRLLADIVAKVEHFEPRVKVLKIEFVDPGQAAASAGTLIPRVTVRIRDGALL